MKPSMMAIPLVVAFLGIAFAVSPAFGSSPGGDIGGLVTSLFTSPTTIIVFIIELVLGFGLGYFATKVFKYILALIGIFFLGVLLNVWQSYQLGSNLTGQLAQLTLEGVVPVVTSIIVILGLTTVLPITVGFILGVTIAFAK